MRKFQICICAEWYCQRLQMHQAGFSAPTPIQAQSWPVALQGRDIVAIAKTGSGKTLGYLIPGFIHLKNRRSNPQLGPTILVLSPTRELATQIQAEAVKFGKSSRISCTVCFDWTGPIFPFFFSISDPNIFLLDFCWFSCFLNSVLYLCYLMVEFYLFILMLVIYECQFWFYHYIFYFHFKVLMLRHQFYN